jgi:hypothetical protein
LELDWKTFTDQLLKSNYDANDVRPDVVVQKYNASRDSSDSVQQGHRKLEIHSGGGWAGFTASAGAGREKDDFKSFAAEHGLIGEWTGNEFIPKSVKVTQLNKAAIDSIRTMELFTSSVVDRKFYEPITLQLRNFLNGRSLIDLTVASVKAELERKHRDVLFQKDKEHVAVMKRQQDEFQMKIDKLNGELTRLKAPPKTKKETIRVSLSNELMGKWSMHGCKDMDTHNRDVIVQVKSHFEVSREGGHEVVRLVVDFRAQHKNSNAGIFGVASPVVWSNPAAKKIVRVIGREFDSGEHHYWKPHRVLPGNGKPAGIYGIQSLPADYRNAHWTYIDVCFDQAWKKAPELKSYGLQGEVVFDVEYVQ